MAVDFLNYFPQQDFNKVITELSNCDLTAPSYYPGRVPQTFNATQRRSLVPAKDTVNNNIFAACWFTEVYDIKLVTSTAIEYYLIIWLVWSATISGTTLTNQVAAVRYTLTGTNTGMVTLIHASSTTGRVVGVNYKFLQVNGPKMIGNNLITEQYITWTDATWTLSYNNSTDWSAQYVQIIWVDMSSIRWTLASQYIYVYDNTESINSDSVNDIIGWVYTITPDQSLATSNDFIQIKTPPVALGQLVIKNSKWAVLNTVAPIWAFVMDDYLYTYHNIDSTHNNTAISFPVKTFPTPIDAEVTNGYLLVVDKWSNCFPTLYPTSVGFTSGLPLFTTAGTFNITNFRSYTLLISSQFIYSITSTSSADSSGNVTVLWGTLLLTDQFWILQQNAFKVYNGWLYVISSHNQRFLAVDIYPVPSSTTQFSLVFQDQWMYIQKYLDNIASTDTVRIEVNDQHIYIIRNTGWITTIYVYDMLYKWWHVWQTSLNLLSCRYETFFGYGIYQYNVPTGYDIDQTNTDQPYSQQITLLEWESSMFQVKNSKFLKLVIGPNTNVGTVLNATVYVGWKTETYTFPLNSARYLGGPWAMTGNALGGSILNEWILWLGTVATTTSISTPICDLEIPTWFFYQILKLTINPPAWTWVQFAGMMSGFIISEPQITNPLNVIIEN